MGQSEKNKVVIHVECMHDPTFEIANYRPAGTEHVRELNVYDSGIASLFMYF